MNFPKARRVTPPKVLQKGCEPHTSTDKDTESVNLPSSNADAKALRTGDNSIHRDFGSDQTPVIEDSSAKIQELFEKSFHYQKYKPNSWHLPNSYELFKEYYQFETLQALKTKLNEVKSKLNNYVLEDWSLHTRRQDPASEIPWRLKTETHAEFVTVAWCKMYECICRFPDLIKGPTINSLHLCEAPGAFITALNHYLYTNYNKNDIHWNWLATTLNPYYEGNPMGGMIVDDRFLLHTFDNWLFHKDFTGNIINLNNLEHMQEECEKRLGKVDLITADGSVDCTESPDVQEEKVALLHYAEIINALTILSTGGSFIIKMFTLFEASSVNKLFLLNCAFENVHVFKPCTSKRGNSEVYVVCLNYKRETENLLETIEKMKTKLNVENSMLWPLLSKTSLPVDFLKQHEICCRIFMNHQINAIEKNIHSYEIRPHKSVVKRLQILRSNVSREFYKRYNIRKLPEELKILYKFKNCIANNYMNQIYKGSYSEREMFKKTSKEEKIFMYRKHINDLEKVINECLEQNTIMQNFETSKSHDLTLYRGKGVTAINSSLFTNVNLLIMRSKLNELFYDASHDSLWLQNPRMEYNSNESSVNFNDFATDCGNFSIQQENFFNKVIDTLLATKPNLIKFINMPFLTHYSVSVLYYLFNSVYSKLSFSIDYKFEIILTSCSRNFVERLEDIKIAMSSSLHQDIFCFLNILELHRNDFYKSLCAFNNMLLLQNFKQLLNN